MASSTDFAVRYAQTTLYFPYNTNICVYHQITALQASDNNRSATVLDLFKRAVTEYGMPSRVRGDRGGENLDVATYVIMKNGSHRASFMWGS